MAHQIDDNGDGRQEAIEATKAASLLDLLTGWYDSWYFALRLHEEIGRTERSRLPLCLVRIRIDEPGPPLSPERWRLFITLGEIVFDGLRSYDVAGMLDRSNYAVLLPDTSEAAAQAVADRLESTLSAFAPRVRVLVYPRDAASAEALVDDGVFDAAAPSAPPSPVPKPTLVLPFPGSGS